MIPLFGNFGGALNSVVVGFTNGRWDRRTPSPLSITGGYLLAAGCGPIDGG